MVRSCLLLLNHIEPCRVCEACERKDIDAMLPSMRPGLFWTLWRWYRHLLKGKAMRKVHPIPSACVHARPLNVEDPTMVRSRLLLLNHIEPCRVCEASECKEVDALFADKLGETAADIRTTLQGLLMKRERSKRKDTAGRFVHTESYKFTFPNVGVQWVKLNRAGKNLELR